MKNLNLAFYGYQSDTGKALIELLSDAQLPITQIYPLSYNADPYDAVNILDKNCPISDPNEFDYTKCNVLIFIGSKGDCQKIIPQAKENGVIIIDASLNTYDEKPYVYVEGLDNEELKDAFIEQHIVPMNSSATMLAQILKPVTENLGLKRAIITLMEAISGLSKDGANELARETVALLNMRPIEPKLFNTQVAFNLHTQVGDYTSDGTTTHEYDLLTEIQSVIGDVAEGINLTSIVVPVFYGHTASITLTTKEECSLEKFRNTLSQTKLLTLIDDEEITPTTHGVNEETIYISRIREDRNIPNTFTFTAIMDNAKIGLASNCLSILKEWVKDDEDEYY